MNHFYLTFISNGTEMHKTILNAYTNRRASASPSCSAGAQNQSKKYQFSIKIYMPHAENGETRCRNELWSTNKYNLARALRQHLPLPPPHTSSTLFQSIRYAIYHFGFGCYFRSTSHIKMQCFGQCTSYSFRNCSQKCVCAPVFAHASFFWAE